MYLCYFYKVCNSENNKEYVGSTKQPISHRMTDHRKKVIKGSDRKLHNHMRDLGIDKFSIVELERKEVADRQEQFKIETEWMEKINSCLNERRAKTIPEKKLEIARKYKSDNSDKVKSDWKKYEKNNNPLVVCDCGIMIKKLSLNRHKKSKNHLGGSISNEDKHEKDLERWKKYREDNRDKVNERSKKYKENNKKKISKYNKEYAQKNKIVIQCECGKSITKRKIKAHKESKYHKSHCSSS